MLAGYYSFTIYVKLLPNVLCTNGHSPVCVSACYNLPPNPCTNELTQTNSLLPVQYTPHPPGTVSPMHVISYGTAKRIMDPKGKGSSKPCALPKPTNMMMSKL